MISNNALELIKKFEGIRLVAYPDPKTKADPWTIGYGHTKGVKQGDTCDYVQADKWLLEDADEASTQVLEVVKGSLSQSELDALTSFVFNLGIGRFKSSTMLKKLNTGDKEGASNEFLKWISPGTPVEAGLRIRRHLEKDLFDGNIKWTSQG